MAIFLSCSCAANVVGPTNGSKSSMHTGMLCLEQCFQHWCTARERPSPRLPVPTRFWVAVIYGLALPLLYFSDIAAGPTVATSPPRETQAWAMDDREIEGN